MVDIAGRGLLELTGPQRIWFLQQTITTDVDELPSGRWVESCFLSPKGKLLSHFRVGVLGESVWIDVDPPSTAGLVEWFVKYRFRTKVEIAEQVPRSHVVIGPDAAALAGPGEITTAGAAIVFGDVLGDEPMAVVHGELPAGIVEVTPEAFDHLRLEAGVAMFGVDYGTDHLPQEAGLTRAVSVHKGCYVGQETIARIHFRGHINKVVRPLRFEGVDATDAVGRSLLDGSTKVGTISSAIDSPRLGAVGIGMVAVSASETLDVDGGGTATLGAIPEGTKVKT